VLSTTARVLLAAANLPPIFHPFAIQTAAWIHNRLPRPSRGNETPYYVLTRSLPSLAMLYCFGCLAAVVDFNSTTKHNVYVPTNSPQGIPHSGY
jgi:hypothetical protein